MSTCRASLCRVAWSIFSNPHRGLGDRTTIVYPHLTDEETELERGSIRKAPSPEQNPGPSGSKACGWSFFLKHFTMTNVGNVFSNTTGSCLRFKC